MKKKFWILGICLLLLSVISPAFAAGTWIPFAYEHNGQSYPYTVYLPPEYNNQQSWPIILFLHGKGESGKDGIQPTQVGIGEAIVKFPERYPAIVVFPQATKRHHWNIAAREMAVLALDKVTTEFNGDPTRTYLTGLSLGGFAAWKIAAQNPNKFAAVVPVSSFLRPLKFAAQLAQIPIWAFSGAWDFLVPPFIARIGIRSIRKAGGTDVRYTSVPRAFHNSWDAAYATEAMTSWLFEQHLGGKPVDPAGETVQEIISDTLEADQVQLADPAVLEEEVTVDP
jgi:predicted peptidase